MIEHNSYQYIRPGKVAVLVDGQFGSTGKGLLAAYLALQSHNEVDVAVTNASANAGHTTKFRDDLDGAFVCYHLPTFGVIQPDAEIYLNAGAIIDPKVLLEEIDKFGVQNRLGIHPMAAIIRQGDKNYERAASSATTQLASTQKGVGSALAFKIQRKGEVAKDCEELKPWVGAYDLNGALTRGSRVSMEVPQGYSLSINGPFYPYCTSRNCTVAAGLNDANIHPEFLGSVSMSLRTFPIRVGNIYDDDGKQIGWSGPCYTDQKETSWEEIGVEPEITTVTKRVRRVFGWSQIQYRSAVQDNRPNVIFLNFTNYCTKEEFDLIQSLVYEGYKKEIGGGLQPYVLYGYGPCVEDITADADKVITKETAGHETHLSSGAHARIP